MLYSSIRFFIKNKLLAIALLLFFLFWGWVSTPFNFENGFLSGQKVSVDAIPDIGENQQIIYTVWEGQSPQDIEDQITYPLTSGLLGIQGVQTVRGNSMFGYSSIYLVFEDNIDFYRARNRILEKLSSLPSDLLPNGVRPKLGPDATSLGQIFWYTLEGRDETVKLQGAGICMKFGVFKISM